MCGGRRRDLRNSARWQHARRRGLLPLMSAVVMVLTGFIFGIEVTSTWNLTLRLNFRSPLALKRGSAHS
jgi:hypothetical protein